MKKTLKLIAIICTVAMLAGVFSTVGLAAEADIDYVITSPYADVDWSWQQYKADLHSHTTASDGDDTLKAMTEAEYSYGFDIYAVTDHGVTSISYTEQTVIPELKFFLDLKNPNAPVIPLEETGLTFEGLTYNVVTENGDDYYYQIMEDGTEGHRMLRVPFGIENNPTSLNNAHVNSWFGEFNCNLPSGYRNAITGADGNMLNYKENFLPIYVISNIWQECGWGSIIYLAALTGIDQSLYEAAEVDGAGKWKKVISITLPSILPTIIIMLIMRMGSILSVGYEKILLLGNDATSEVSDVLSTYNYEVGIKQSRYSYSAAIGLFNTLVNLAFVQGANWISRKVNGYALW